MTETPNTTDTGLALGQVVLKVLQVLFVILAVSFFYLAFLGTQGFFEDWNIRIDPDISWLFPMLTPERMVSIILVGVGIKFVLFFGLFAWIERRL